MLQQGSYTRTGGANVSAGVWPRFYIESIEDPLASQREGRPIFRDEERVEIIMAGSPHTKPVKIVDDEIRGRWPKEYAAFKQGIEISPDGTPLEQWPILKRGQVLELKALGFLTVEQLATMNDNAIQRIGMGGRRIKELAEAFLDDAKAVQALAASEAEREKQAGEIARLTQAVEQMGAQMQQLHSQLMDQRNAPNALATHIPGMGDPAEQAKVGYVEPAVSSALANLPRRRGRPPKSEAA